MKRIKLLLAALCLILACGVFAGITHSAYAADPINPFDDVCAAAGTGDDAPSVCKENEADKNSTAKDLNPLSGSGGMLLRAAKLITFVTGVASIIIIILSGLKYAIAGGDSNSINSAKSTLLYAFVGLLIAMMGQGIIVFVVKALK